MTNIKSTILKFLAKWGYNNQTSLKCAKLTINNSEEVQLKVNHTQEELNKFLHELDFEIELDIEHVRGYLWMDNGKVAELDYYTNLDFAEWRHIYIPTIPEELFG